MKPSLPSLRTAVIAVGIFFSMTWLLVRPVVAQSLVSGRLRVERFPGSEARMPLTGVLCFAGKRGPGNEPWSFRTWETEPAGWYRISAGAGNFTFAFTQPGSFIRPFVLNNIALRTGDRMDGFDAAPRFDFANFHEKEWDRNPGRSYFQTFTARGRAVTQVGFRVAHDGVDGFGPGHQNLVISVHERSDGPPDQWPRLGPERIVFNVDSGGGKNYWWAAGWNSGEIPLVPGRTYAVQVRTEKPERGFQPFWRTVTNAVEDCYRIGTNGTGFQGRHLWLAIATDGDGLLLPYNKRIQKEFGNFAGMSARWSQTYVAQGRGIAAVFLYAAVSGAQPPLSRQRVTVRIRRGGPAGPVVGVEKVAIGNGNYTGDASWGRFGAVFAPGEVPLVPGQTYAIEWESLENRETLHGFVNIKGQVSDGRPGFNPYRKHERDAYEDGTAFKGGTNDVSFDLDAQIVEYEFAPPAGLDWEHAVDAGNLLRNGGFQLGDATAEHAVGSRLDAWKTFATDPGTTHAVVVDAIDATNRIARVIGGGWNGKTVDGGFVQRVDGLKRQDTYRLFGRLRSSWAVDAEHQCFVGHDATGQTEDAQAVTIEWTTLPAVHGIWTPYVSAPIRPSTNAVSVWLRGRTTRTGDKFAPFKADFDEFALRRVITGPPGSSE